MPNWCNNNLRITGDEKLIVEFAKVVIVQDEDAETSLRIVNHYPCPKELSETVSGWAGDTDVQAEREKQYESNLEKYGYKDWYDWSLANWGTKWGDCETQLVHHFPTEILYAFDTAWGPPIELIEKLSAKYPTLTFTIVYEELGMGFMGVQQMLDSQLLLEYSIDVDSTSGVIEVGTSTFEYIPYSEDKEDDHYDTFYLAVENAREALLQL